MVKVGDRLIVQDLPQAAYIEKIEYDAETDRTVIFLDWKEFGKSRVYLHDEGKTWRRYLDQN